MLKRRRPLPGLIDLPYHAQAIRKATRKAAPKRVGKIVPKAAPKRAPRRPAPIESLPIALPYDPQVGPGADQRRNDCGPACVRMALDFLGKAPGLTIDALAAQIDAADDGTTAEELVALARAQGADAFVVSTPADALPEAPAILLVRYSGFDRATVQDKHYWDLSAQNPGIMHWAWWLGNVQIDGKWVSVWNDPLFTGQGGKAVLRSLDALDRAFAPYFGARVSVKFTSVFNPPTDTPLSVAPRDSDGVNFRSTPEIRIDNLIERVAAGTALTVLEDTDGARVKLTAPAWTYWLRVRTPAGRVGYVAGWLVVERAQPLVNPAITALKLVAPTRAATLHAAAGGTAVWSVAEGAPLKVLDTNGAGWLATLAKPEGWLEVESYAGKRGFVRANAVALPAALDARTPVDDTKLKFGDTAWLYGIHDDFGARRAELFGNKKGWVLLTEEVNSGGSSAYPAWGPDPAGFGVLARLNNGYNDGFRGPGTIPRPADYDAFAQRCAGWAQRTLAGRTADHTCTFIIGNEMNNPREWPNPGGASNAINWNSAITPQSYADCFNRAYRAIKAVAPGARVLPGAVDPYNALYMDCLQYFTLMLSSIEALDGFAFHTYTHGPETARVTSDERFRDDPLRWQYYDFRSYQTLMDLIPAKWRAAPVYLTESDQTPTAQQPRAWSGGRNGWVRAAYQEIERWNRQPLAQQIQALILYRWVRGGGDDAAYCLQDHPDILAELRDTVAATDFRWRF